SIKTMQTFEIILFLLALPLFIYRIANRYWRHSLMTWLKTISLQYGIRARELDFFHRKIIACDKERHVILFLDEENNKQEGHIIGFHEIIGCELVIHETGNETGSCNIDRIDLELQLKTGGKQVIFCLYEKNFF